MQIKISKGPPSQISSFPPTDTNHFHKHHNPGSRKNKTKFNMN